MLLFHPPKKNLKVKDRKGMGKRVGREVSVSIFGNHVWIDYQGLCLNGSVGGLGVCTLGGSGMFV